jgi:hypothetical protein
LAKSLKELRKDYQDITESTREAYDKLFPPFGDDRENLDKNYKKAVRDKDKEEIARLKPLWESASNAYKQEQTRKNALNLKIKKLEREEKKTETAKEEKKTVLGGYEKALNDLNEAELDLQGYQGEDKYQKAYIKAQDAYNKAVSSGKTPSTPLPKPKIEIKPIDKVESEKTDAATGEVFDKLTEKYNQDIANSGRYIAGLDDTGRKLLAESLNEVYRNNLSTNGKYSQELKDAYTKALQDNYARSLDFNQIVSLPEFLVTAANEGTYRSGSGAGAGPSMSGSISDPTRAAALINSAFRSQLQRDPTAAEVTKYTKLLNNAEKKNPFKTVKGITTGGLDKEQFLIGELVKLPEFATKKTDKVAITGQSILGTARANGVTLNQSQIDSFAKRVQDGTDIKIIDKEIRSIAALGMPDKVIKLLDQGVDLDTIYSPYRNLMASILELNPESIDLKDPTLRSAIGPDKEMPIYDFEKALRKDYRWQYTDNAKRDVSNVALKVLRDFGFQS